MVEPGPWQALRWHPETPLLAGFRLQAMQQKSALRRRPRQTALLQEPRERWGPISEADLASPEALEQSRRSALAACCASSLAWGAVMQKYRSRYQKHCANRLREQSADGAKERPTRPIRMHVSWQQAADYCTEMRTRGDSCKSQLCLVFL